MNPTLLCLTLLAVSLLLLASCATPAARPSSAKLDPHTWTSTDGKVMPHHHWPAAHKSPTAPVIIAVHGLSGAKSDFWYLADQLCPTGIDVYAFDLRSQGHDPDIAHRGDIPSPTLWQRDLATYSQLIRQRHPHRPVIWLGESLGSLITLHTTCHPPPDAIILTSPAAGIRHPIPIGRRLLFHTASRLLPTQKLTLETLSGINDTDLQVTSEVSYGDQMARTPHHVPAFSLRLLRIVGHLIDTAPSAARRCHQPTLVLASPHDALASAEQIEALFDQLPSPSKKLHWYPQSRHLLLHDVDRQQVTSDIRRWLRTL